MPWSHQTGTWYQYNFFFFGNRFQFRFVSSLLQLPEALTVCFTFCNEKSMQEIVVPYASGTEPLHLSCLGQTRFSYGYMLSGLGGNRESGIKPSTTLSHFNNNFRKMGYITSSTLLWWKITIQQNKFIFTCWS